MKTETVSKIVTMEELNQHYNPEQVEGYCQQCPNYGRVWSCPPHSFTGISYTKPYNYVLLIAEKIYPPANAGPDMLNEVFQKTRRSFGNRLIALSQKHSEQAEVLIAGNCYQCEVCRRETGEPCQKAESLKYSLEAVGYEVGPIAENLLEVPLRWKGKKGSDQPQYLTTVAAVLAKSIETINEITPDLLD